MDQQNPDDNIQVPRWTWDLFLDYIEAVEWLFLAAEALNDRGALQLDLKNTFLRVSNVIAFLDRIGPEVGTPGESSDLGAVPEQSGPEPLKQRAAASMAGTAYAEAKRHWCIYLSSGRVPYYGTKAGAIDRCYKLAAPANISCQGVGLGCA
jgi:hypothetical protein